MKKLVAQVKAWELIKLGFLTPPISEAPVGSYRVTEKLDTVTTGKGRLTSQIVAQVVRASVNRRGVMFFAATIEHAYEIQESIPEARVITGNMSKKDRTRDINAFKNQEYKYIISVGTLTTGFDAAHVDVIAILRATESAGLLQQIIGRGLRLFLGKLNCLVMDFAGNIERHGLEDDLFDPKVEAYEPKPPCPMEVDCPLCHHVNEFGKRQDAEYADFSVDDKGNFVDLAGNPIMTEHGPVQAHYGRRCKSFDSMLVQCAHRWTHKKCNACEYENDITARRCKECKAEMIDPNEKLEAQFKKMKKDAKQWSTDKVLEWYPVQHVSKKGDLSIKVTYKTEYRTFHVWYHVGTRNWNSLCSAVFGSIHPGVGEFLMSYAQGHATMPTTVTVVKKGKWFNINGHNQHESIWQKTHGQTAIGIG